MAYVFWIVVFVLFFRLLKNKLGEGTSALKDNLNAIVSRQDNLAQLLERLYIEGYIFGEPATGATHDNPRLVSHTGLANLLDSLSDDSSLEQLLPRIGFSIRTLANCDDITFVRQYTRMLVTPGNYAIGYGCR